MTEKRIKMSRTQNKPYREQLGLGCSKPTVVSAPPDFGNILAVLRRERPSRPTLFEFFLNGPLYEKLAGLSFPKDSNSLERMRVLISAFKNAGYDYVTVPGSLFAFPIREHRQEKTKSLTEGSLIHDRKDFEAYDWPNPDDFDYSSLNKISSELPDGMKLMVFGPCGVLENVMQLVGYETICYIIADDPKLAEDIFEAVGSRLVRYYELSAIYNTVGVLMSNDDWGFKTQTMLSPNDMRKFVFPWHKQIVSVAHAAGKPAILHSCGCLTSVMDDVIDDMGYDGKHSYEDTIQSVESFYAQYHDRIAVLGGIDLDFICRSTPEKIYRRSKKILERAESQGAYALGTGNSVPAYVPDKNYFAMIQAALDFR